MTIAIENNGHLRDAVILITGGTGSLGSAILDRVLAAPFREIRVFSRDEHKHLALRHRFPDPRIRFLVGDVRDRARVAQVVMGVHVVVHAAALKQVHFSEAHPYEAVRTNIEGAQNVVQACLHAGVRTLVAVSTDKAVVPINVMGMTKAIQERVICAAAAQVGFHAGCVRFGNVLASTGSVVLYFRELLRQGTRVLPVTDRQMTRFMMTLPMAADFVLHASRVVADGEILVCDLPAFRVVDLADVMLEAHGGGKVEFVGIRPGEKIHEMLISNVELPRTTRVDEYFVIRRHSQFESHHLPGISEYASNTVRIMDKTE